MEKKKSTSTKVFVLILAGFLALWGLLYFCQILIGQNMSRMISRQRYEYRDVGNFRAVFYNDGNNCRIYGTTDLVKDKEFLVIPEYLNGARVKALGDFGYFFTLAAPKIESETLKKIYFESAIDYRLELDAFNSPNFKKIIYPDVNDDRRRNTDCDVYYPRHIYERKSETEYYSNEHPANVSFYYNYKDAENCGYHWIDDCDYGGKIEYVPKTPTRDGYTFGGWYKEPECINKWNFDVDTLPEEKTEQKEAYRYNYETQQKELYYEDVTVYQETILYAKWL